MDDAPRVTWTKGWNISKTVTTNGMALHWFYVSCQICQRPFWLRAQIGYEPVQRFVAPCPVCGSLLRGTLEPEGLNKFRLTSNQFTRLQDGPDPYGEGLDLPTVTVAVDVPQFSDQIVARAIPGMTPFMQLVQYVPQDWMVGATYPRLHPDWKAITSAVEPAVESYLTNDRARFKLQLDWLEAQSAIEFPRTPAPISILNMMRVPFFSASNPAMLDVLDQLRSVVRNLLRQPQAVHDTLRSELAPHFVAELRRKCWRSACRLVLNQGALTSSHYAEAIRKSGGPYEKLRSVRGDYDVLAHAYLSAFEAASWAVGFQAVLEAAAITGDTRPMVDGRSSNLGKILDLDAKDREPLASGPLASLLAEVSRVVRNKIGHNAAHYDFQSGEIEFDNGKKTTLLDLQCQLLNMFRLGCWYSELSAIVEILASGQALHKRMFWEPRMGEGGRTVFLLRE